MSRSPRGPYFRNRRSVFVTRLASGSSSSLKPWMYPSSCRMRALPTALGHACHVAFERQLAETQTAEREFSHVGARPPAQTAPVAQPNLELRRLLFSSDLGGCGHSCFLRGAKRHPDKLQQAF